MKNFLYEKFLIWKIPYILKSKKIPVRIRIDEDNRCDNLKSHFSLIGLTVPFDSIN